MEAKKTITRNSALDIIRIVAVFTVISIHFFLHNGFYSQTVQGIEMYITVIFRSFLSVCVPLFIILTGYLMCNKTLSKKYYSGIVKTLLVFVISTVFCMVFKHIEYNDPFNLREIIFGTLDYTGANYSWYIEMYIGLFLIIPFLNLAYNKLGCKRHKQILVITLVAITILPTLFNSFSFDSATWWADPKSSEVYQKLIPDYWLSMYPIAYYFTGCYLREYGLKLKTSSLLIVFLLTIFLFGTFNFYRFHGGTYKIVSYTHWYGFEPYITATLMFALMSRIKTDRYSNGKKWVLWKLSDLALGMYLISYVFDTIFYPILNTKIPVFLDRLPFYFVIVPLIFVCSAVASAIMNAIASFIMFAYRKIVQFIKEQRQRSDKYKWQDFMFIALMAGGLIFAFWKCRYGFGGNDEAFYLTVPHRLSLGDAFIKDEWHLSQLSGFLTLPFVWLYTTIMQTTEGIILTARVVYIIFHAVVSIVIYTRLRKFGYLSVFACALYFIYTPYNIMAMSYNTMGLDFIALTGALMGTADYTKKLPLIISGVCFAASVLCCPYLAIGFILYALCVLVHTLIKNKSINIALKSDLFAIRTFIYFTIGVAGLAVVFLLFALSRVSIGEILENLPYLMTDPEHPSIPLTTKISSYFRTIFDCHSHFKYALYTYVMMLIVMIFDRKRKLHRSLYLITTSAIVIFCYILFLPELTFKYYNAIMFPLIFIGITSYILCDNKPKELIVSLFALGIIYSVCICFSSNQYFYVIAMAVSASNIASLVFLGQLIREMNDSPDNIEYAVWMKRSSFVLVVLMMLMQSGMQLTSKANHCFWESDMSTLTYKMTKGPAKGIYTNYNNFNEYETIYSDIKDYETKQIDNILFLTEKTWTYLAAEDFSYGTLSAWNPENQSTVQRLNLYYSVNPDKKPEYVYVLKKSKWNLTNIYSEAASHGYKITESDVSYKLEKI